MYRFPSVSSMRVRVPALIAVGTGSVLVFLAALGYARMASHLKAEAGQRLEVVAEQLQGLLEASLENTEGAVTRESKKPEMRALATAPRTPAAVREAEEAVIAFMSRRGLESVRTYQVTSGDDCILIVQRESDAPLAPRDPAEGCLPPAPVPGEELWAVSPLVAEGGELFADVSYRLPDEDENLTETLGTLRVTIDASTAVDRLSGLISDDARFLIGTPGGIWSDLSEPTAVPADTLGLGLHDFVDPATGPRMAMAAPIANSPWVVWIERSVDQIVSPATDLRGELIASVLGALVLLTLITIAVTERFMRPLRDLTRAAVAIRRGELHERVRSERTDELGILAHAFDSMAESVQESTDELEDRVAARTAELEQALANLREVQEELIRKERLAMLGELAGGVGHEIRTPLSVIQNAIYLLEQSIDDPPPKVREYFDMMRTQIEHSVSIITNLLELGRVRPPRRQELEMPRFITSVLSQAELPDGVSKDVRVPDGCPAAAGDITQIGQALRNLVVNASDAMEGKGQLTIEVTREEGQVATYVSDTGCGVPSGMESRVFDPLVTTKARGVGLGLALSRTLVMNNGGSLELLETGEDGSTFVIRLPLFEKSAVLA